MTQEQSAIVSFETTLTSRLGVPTPVPSPPEVSVVWTLPGLEIALARTAVPTNSRKRVWRDRIGKGSTPLIVVFPSSTDTQLLTVLGPREQALDTPFSADLVGLAQRLESVRHLPALAASRQLEQALEWGGWRNKLIWGDNKIPTLVAAPEFAGKVDLVYIDPPFATGQNFSVRLEVGDYELTKKASVLEVENGE